MNEKFDEINQSLDIEVQAGEIVKETTKQQLKQRSIRKTIQQRTMSILVAICIL